MNSVNFCVQYALLIVITNAASDIYHTITNLHNHLEQFGILRYSNKWLLWYSWEYRPIVFGSYNAVLNLIPFKNGHGKGYLK
jgi:hypothetical protein